MSFLVVEPKDGNLHVLQNVKNVHGLWKYSGNPNNCHK